MILSILLPEDNIEMYSDFLCNGCFQLLYSWVGPGTDAESRKPVSSGLLMTSLQCVGSCKRELSDSNVQKAKDSPRGRKRHGLGQGGPRFEGISWSGGLGLGTNTWREKVGEIRLTKRSCERKKRTGWANWLEAGMGQEREEGRRLRLD